MRVDIEELNQFYQGSLGSLVTKVVAASLTPAMGDISGQDLLGFGHASPYLENYYQNARRCVNFSPSSQGVANWPKNAKNQSVLGNENNTPFAEASFDKILAVHALEEAQNPQKMLRELWRILAPEGKIIFIISNRNGIWSRLEQTPFGHGRPYSRTQILRLFENSMFEIEIVKRILFSLPFAWSEKISQIEAIGSALWPRFGGLIFLEAKKRIYIEPNVTQTAGKIRKIATKKPQIA
ncbi:MAG: class I SAM-dependent methyltransferase [Pseudomonadota bacterium]